jgi:hypothetical protein
MNVISYITKMNDMDLLKYLFLNRQQIDLFNFLSKPSVSLTSRFELTEALQEKFSSDFNKEEINRMYSSYNSLTANINPGELDRKLMNIVISEVERLTCDN